MEYWFAPHQIMELAAKMESKGEEFYKHLGSIAQDPLVCDMCEFFADQEHEHGATLMKIAEAHHAESKHLYSVDVCGMLQTPMHNMATLLDGNLSAPLTPAHVNDFMELAEQVESTAISVYSKIKEQYSDELSDVLTEMVEEEKKHLQMVQSIRKNIFE